MIATIIKNNLMDFADWLKTNRKREKLSLRRLAEKMDYICSDAYLSQLENRRYQGKKGQLMRPDKEIVIALAKVLNADVNEALRLADYAAEESTNKPKTVAEFVAALKKMGVTYSDMPDVDLEKLPPEAFAQLLDTLETNIRVQLKKIA